ncbi:SDR family NAD(P)-dependent oxidoreductase [Thalassobacillus pellis]|uniref:SDR family NAD(P)-dependent oxidoreductase n=1 Tax=Thalassobacillus pellis TaxID=748008 RepID=UPI00196047FD|nr:SDR family NAD(P)-dependent oxidoreductase [Thalassobacillus pellis]MBM7551483.1 3-oxoacyl-[acyl-carrier protein] reductase [Thalassobacillus pellis]
MNKLQDEVVIVTGSTRGIGRSTALALAEAGASVVVNGRSSTNVEKVISEIEQTGGRGVGVAGSVTETDMGERLTAAAVDNFGDVTGIINNAGVTRDQIAHRMGLRDFQEVIDTHVTGTFICSQPVIRYFKETKRQGFLLQMTSLAGLVGNIGQVNYSAAKAAILGMTWTLAKELKRDGIKVNALAPAALTDMTRPHIEKAKKEAATEEEAAYWDVGSSEQVAQFIVDYIVDRNIHQTGEIYAVNKKERGRWLPPSYEML